MVSLAISGDLQLATNGDFHLATDMPRVLVTDKLASYWSALTTRRALTSGRWRSASS